MIKTTLIVLWTIFSFACYANFCTVKAPDNLIISRHSNLKHLKEAFTFQNCSDKLKKSFVTLAKDYRGELTQRQVALELKNKTIQLINSLQIITLEDYLKKNLNIDKNFVIAKAKFVTSRSNYISLNEFDDIRIECKDCNTMGKKTAQITTQNQSNQRRQFWLKFDIATPLNILTPLRTLNVTNRPLSPKYFQWSKIITDTPEAYFTDLRNIRFYYTNHVLKKNDPLKTRSLSRAKLVHYGRPVVVQMTSGSLKLKGKAIPTTSGHLGDTISLKNNRTKKVIVGKVIDENLVEVEL